MLKYLAMALQLIKKFQFMYLLTK